MSLYWYQSGMMATAIIVELEATVKDKNHAIAEADIVYRYQCIRIKELEAVLSTVRTCLEVGAGSVNAALKHINMALSKEF